MSLERIALYFMYVENGLVVVLTVLLFVISLLQIFLRDIFGGGIIWSDVLLRHTVVWIGLIGAMRATAEDKHIRIDLLPKFLPPAKSLPFRIVSDAVPFVICFVLLMGSITFVQNERLTNSMAFPGVPYWWLQLAFPASFAVMAARYGAQLLNKILVLNKGSFE